MSHVATQSQLTILGGDDMNLTKDPSLQLFTPKYQTYTPLASTFQFHRPQGDVSGLSGEKVSFSLRRTGDLLKNMFIRFRGPVFQNLYPTTSQGTVLGGTSVADATDRRYQFLWGPLAYYAIDSVEMKLNSTTVDTLYGDWMYVWSEFLQPTSDRAEMKTLATKLSTPDASEDSCKNEYFYLPIPFWFTSHPSLALPLVALANTEIKITVTFAKTAHNMNLLNSNVKTDATLNASSLSTVELMTEEITLCEAEREWFATKPLSYLITQHTQREEYPFTLEKTSVNSASNYEPNSTSRITTVADQDTTLSLENFRLPIRSLWLGMGGFKCTNTSTNDPDDITFLHDNRLVQGAFYTESYLLNEARELTERADVRERSHIPPYQDGSFMGTSSSFKKRFSVVAGQGSSQETTKYQPSLFSFSMSQDDLHPEGAINFSRLKSARIMLKGGKLAPFPSGLRTDYESVESNYVVLAENYNVLDIRDGTAYVRHTD